MKNTNAVSKFINSDIEKAKRDLETRVKNATNSIKIIPTEAVELGKKYFEIVKAKDKELEAIKDKIEKLGCSLNYHHYGDKSVDVRLNTPNFPSEYSYGRASERVVATIPLGNYVSSINAVLKDYNSKIVKLDGLKRTFEIKLLGGIEVEKILKDLADKLADILE